MLDKLSGTLSGNSNFNWNIKNHNNSLIHGYIFRYIVYIGYSALDNNIELPVKNLINPKIF